MRARVKVSDWIICIDSDQQIIVAAGVRVIGCQCGNAAERDRFHVGVVENGIARQVRVAPVFLDIFRCQGIGVCKLGCFALIRIWLRVLDFKMQVGWIGDETVIHCVITMQCVHDLDRRILQCAALPAGRTVAVDPLTGDGLWEGKEGSTNSVIEKKKVVFLTKSMDSSFWQSAYAGAGAASAEYNLDLVCEGPDGDGEEDYEAQNEMIDRAIREQVDALLFSAIDFEKNAKAIDRAAKAGIRIVVVDSPVNSEAVECYIGTDNYEAGCMAGEEVLGNPAENLNIGIVNFDKSTENGQLREKGFRDTVLNDDRANITASINVKSTITDAREGTERMLLDNPQINVIVTFNEWTTLGVGDAVEALGAGERTQVVAFDSNVKSIGMLEKGNVDALIVQNPYAMGYLGIEQINTLLNGQKPEKKETATSSILVTRENMYDDKSQKALFSFEEK